MMSERGPLRPRKAKTTALACWYYIDEKGIELYNEVSGYGVVITNLTWRQIEAAVRRKP